MNDPISVITRPPIVPARLQRLLARPHAARGVVLLGVLLCAPSLWNGLNLDDVLLAARFADGAATPWNMFDLFGGAAPLVAPQDDPWWHHDAMRLQLMRPLAALTHMFDLRLFTSPVWMHLHSLLWYGLLLAAVGRLYRTTMPGAHVWAPALLLYAVDHSHGMVVGWLAARGAIVGALGAVLCLLAHDRWRTRGRWSDAVLAALALSAALLANEGAVGAGGYLAAYALCRERGPWWRRAASLVPAAVIVVIWRACTVAAGYGAAHSGFYFDPASEGAWFLGRAVVHAILMIGSQVFVPVGEALGMAPGLYGPGAVVVAGLLAGVLWLARGELRGSPSLRFWAVGALLSALPLGATLPTDRQLLLIGVGVFGFAGAWLAEPPTRPRPRIVRGLAWAWLGLHLVVSPLLVPLRATSPAQIHGLAESATAAVVTATPPRQVILVRVPNDLVMLYGRAGWRLHARPFPGSLQYLYAGLGELTITRIDAHTLELRPADGWLRAPLDRLHRAADDELRAGQQIHRAGLTVMIVEATDDGRPTVVRVRLDRPLEDPGLAWYTWEGRTPRPVQLPAIGEAQISPPQPNPLLSP